MKKSELRTLIREELKKLNESALKYPKFWDELGGWPGKNTKRYSWKQLKLKMQEIAPNYGINITDANWKWIFARYKELEDQIDFGHPQYFEVVIDKDEWFEKTFNRLNNKT